jgi:hypothetical protein
MTYIQPPPLYVHYTNLDDFLSELEHFQGRDKKRSIVRFTHARERHAETPAVEHWFAIGSFESDGTIHQMREYTGAKNIANASLRMNDETDLRAQRAEEEFRKECSKRGFEVRRALYSHEPIIRANGK